MRSLSTAHISSSGWGVQERAGVSNIGRDVAEGVPCPRSHIVTLALSKEGRLPLQQNRLTASQADNYSSGTANGGFQRGPRI